MSNLLIVGSEGRMGKWFYRYFRYLNKNKKDQKLNCDILPISNFFLVDTRYHNVPIPKSKRDVFTSSEINDFINVADIIVLCTPTKVTLDILKKNRTLFRPNCLIIEISSLKEIVHKRIRSLLKKSKKIEIISVHPMFGPGALLNSNQNAIIHVPIDKNAEAKDSGILQILFPKFKITTIYSPSEHDTLISLIISLIYFINLIYARIVLNVSNSINSHKKDVNIDRIKEIAGSSFKVQSLLTESIMTDDNSLFVSLLLDSPRSLKLFKEYSKLYNDLISVLEQKDNIRLVKMISQTRNELADKIDISKSYDLLYKFLNR